ncbi:hypothetical protein IWW38_003549 [Coemansia aciculifera]|uniref:Uncharacterized protein n=1 Tax=Coemansia aciculifera TaxID=417176 RepID=A0ACC1M155_9FUNG|nr:hypothetical protein IWW38_003549 [Coemansia aciculifera]
MRAADDSIEAQYSSIALSSPHIISGFVPSPLVAPLCDQDFARLYVANAITRQQQQQALLSGQQHLVSMASGVPLMYSPPLSATSFSTGISATPPLTDCMPSPYAAPYQQHILWPTQADLVNCCNLTSAPLMPMANNISMPTPSSAHQTPTTDCVHHHDYSPARPANAYSEWFV